MEVTKWRKPSDNHRRAGIGACFLITTHARLRRSPSSASNSARPTVTVRPSGKGHLVIPAKGPQARIEGTRGRGGLARPPMARKSPRPAMARAAAQFVRPR
jgi:hypothetical protein